MKFFVEYFYASLLRIPTQDSKSWLWESELRKWAFTCAANTGSQALFPSVIFILMDNGVFLLRFSDFFIIIFFPGID